ncbi:MAG: hypothetical protein Q9226_006901 [Calogaya cf. arnoldii]
MLFLLHNLLQGIALLGIFVLARFAVRQIRGKHGKSHVLSWPFHILSSVRKRAKAWSFLLHGPEIIQDAYDKAKGAPFEVFVPENRYLFISSAKHIKEVDTAPDSVLSLQAAAKQMLQPKYTMHNFDWFDKRGTEGTPLVRTLRTLLTNHIPKLLPDIRLATSESFDKRHDACRSINGVKALPVYSMVKEAVVYANALSFFGRDLAHDQEFLKSATDFIESTLLFAEIIRLTICFALHDLCLHPEYIEPLRKELESPLREEFEQTGKGLPLLDSFIRESARTTPVESMSTRRQALEPFILSGGWKVEVGDMICTPARAMMKDPAHFAAPQEFLGFRFVDPELLVDLDRPKLQSPQPGQPHQLTDATDWQVWGTGRMVCPVFKRVSQIVYRRLIFSLVGIMFADFALRHIPPLLVATALTFGGLMPFFNAEYAIQEFGLPKRIATSKPAQSVMIISSARITAIGIALFTFYLQGKFEAVDTILFILGYVGLVDGYVCWLEGVPGKAVFRTLSGTLIAAWGWYGMTVSR